MASILDRISRAFVPQQPAPIEQVASLPVGFESDQPSRAQPRNAFSSNALVSACVHLRSETALYTPIRVYRGAREVGDRDPVRLLLEEPVLGMSFSDWLSMIWMSHDLEGNAYLLRLRTASRRRVEGYAVLRPDNVRIESARGGVQYVYQVQGGNRFTIPREDIAQFRAVTPYNDWYGLSPIAVAGVAIAADGLMTQKLQTFIRNSNRPAGYLQVKSHTLRSEDEIRLFLDRMNDRLREGRIGWLEGEAEFVPATSIPSPEMTEARQLLETRICTALGVPPLMVGALVGLSMSSGRSEYMTARRSFWEDTVRPMLARFEAFLTRTIREDFGPAYRLEFDLNGVEALNDSIETRARVAALMLRVGAWTPNEAREETGKPPITGGDGDDLRIPMLPTAGAQPGVGGLAQAARELAQQVPAGLERLGTPPTAEETAEFIAPVRQALTDIERAAGGRLGRGETDPNVLIPDSADDVLVQAIRPGYQSVARRAWAVVNDWGGLDELPMTDAVLDAISARAEERWRGINQATRNAVAAAVEAGREAGEDGAVLRRRVLAGLRQSADGMLAQVSDARAEAIARTEMAIARNAGATERYRASNVEEVLVEDGEDWDEACAAVNGTIQTLDWADDNVIQHPRCQRTFYPAGRSAVSGTPIRSRG